MSFNPSKQAPILDSAAQRGSKLNDPNINLQQGYSPFDLTHHEMVTPRFGEYTPFMHLDTTPGDRFVIGHNIKSIHNRIDGNLLSTVNQYDETFFVPLQMLIPNAYERFIPNPVKGSDLPNAALPQVPIALFLANMLYSESSVELSAEWRDDAWQDSYSHYQLMDPTNIGSLIPGTDYLGDMIQFSYGVGWMSFIATLLSRGQLLDYLGFQLDIPSRYYNDTNSIYNSDFQQLIDNYFESLYYLCYQEFSSLVGVSRKPLNLSSNYLEYDDVLLPVPNTRSEFRQFLSDTFERGELVDLRFNYLDGDDALLKFKSAYEDLYNGLSMIFESFTIERDGYFVIDRPTIDAVNTSAEPFKFGFINPMKPYAYQLIVAQYCTNDIVDNIYTSDLFVQNMRSVMFPAVNGLSQEPIYEYNGVQFEYDYMTYGAWKHAFLDYERNGSLSRSYVFASLLFLLRRSLRFGDYFATARTQMLAVGDFSINVADNKVNAVDVTKNLLMQRYANAANYLGNRIDGLYASVYGVTPSDRPAVPRYISHRKTVLSSQLTNNTADEQGKQTTNLVGHADMDGSSIDIFLDDYGVILSLVSYDVLPIYTTGIDRTFSFSDRFDYYNPQLQNIGDQPILKSELYGDFDEQDKVFGYQMRNAEYKFKVSKAHGGFVNDLGGFIFRYPPSFFKGTLIGPDYIRDKPMYFDQLAERMTGTSPANYYHFIVSCVNEVHAARMMQAAPPILF